MIGNDDLIAGDDGRLYRLGVNDVPAVTRLAQVWAAYLDRAVAGAVG